jgi:large subunit ribosomal protein L4
MPEITLYNKEGQEIGSLSLPDAVFGVKPNTVLVHQAVTTEEANRRQGNADTKTRGEIRGGGRKPWRQKGTGRARQGSTRAPHWRHGGVVFGPQPRSYAKALPKKMRHGALRSVLSAKVADGEIIGIDALQVEGAVPRTRQVTEVLSRLPLTREVGTKHYERQDDEVVFVEGTKQKPYNVLLIVPEYDELLLKSCRNIPYVTLRCAPNFSVRDVAVAGRVVLAQGAVSKIEEVLAK